MKIKKSIRCHYVNFFAAVVLLTAAVNVHADYQSTVLNDDPIAYFALDLTIDNNGMATDLSGNGNSSAYYNIYPTAGPTAYIPNAAIFTGVSIQSYVDLSTATNAGILNFGGPITMEAWVQSTNTTQGPADIIGKGYDSSQNYNELVLRANSGGTYNYYGGTYNSTNNGASASGGQQTTNWTYLVAAYDGTNWNLYVNGQLEGQSADTVGAINFSDPWAIGTGSADGASRFFQGNICQVALYTNALTPAQVLTHYYMGEINSSPDSSVPIITAQPQSQPSYVGGSVTFSVAAVSASPMTNQWFKDSSPLAGQTNSTLTLTNLQLGDAGNYSVVVGNANGTTNSVSVSLTISTPASLVWSADANSGVWDTDNSANWIDQSNDQQVVFNSGDRVLFDDTAGVPTSVSVSGAVLPSVITVDADTNNFNISGGTISGSGSLVKEGSSTLTVTSGGNFTGSASINGGMMYAGNNCLASVSSITITNNSTLDMGGGTFNNNKPITVSGTGYNGQGAIINGYNDDPQQRVNITLTGDTLFGFPNRWDMASGSLVSGPHYLTLDPSADQVYPANQSVANPYFEWSANVGADVLGIMLTNGIGLATSNTAVAYMGFHQMQNAFQNPATVFTVAPNCTVYFWDGGYNGSFDVRSGATVYLWTAPAAFNGSTVTLEDNALWSSTGGSGDEPINSAITLNGIAHIVLGDHNMIYTNLISGPGGFIWDAYNHQMVLLASNTYAGPTIIGDGPQVALTGNGSISHSSLIFFGGNNSTSVHLDVSGRSDQTLTLTDGQTLGGIGTINGSLVVASGATLSPAGTNTTIGITTGSNPTGALAASNNITLNGTTIIKLDGSGTNDMVQAGTNIIYGGTLNLANISGSSLAVGDSFQIFSAANYSGSFANITPATPGEGLVWDLSQLSSGKISVVAAGSSGPVVNSTQIIGGNLVLTGTGGTANGTYYVLTATNLVTPLADWIPVSTNTYDANGNFSVTNAFSAGVPQQFYVIKQ